MAATGGLHRLVVINKGCNKLIHIGKPIIMDDEKFKTQLDRLEKAYKEETEDMKDIVAEIVPTYKRSTK